MTRLEIEAFLAIVKHGSISAAAAKLYVSQPALSRRIYALEQELGYELLVRSKGVRFVSLTEEGTAFVSVAEKWSHVYREARSLIHLRQKPTLNLASIGSVSTYLLPNVLRRIIAGESSYNLCFHQYHSFESYGYVESGLIDIALISDDIYHRTVLTVPAFEEPFVMVGGPAWNHMNTVHPTALNPQNEIRLPWNPEFDAWHERWFDASIYPRVQLDQMSLLEEFLTGENYAIVPLIVARKIKNGTAHICQIEDGPENEIIYYLVHADRGRKSDLIDDFLHKLCEEIRQYDGVRLLL